MLDLLAAVLVPVGGDLRAVAVDRVINALFDTDREVLRQLDRIEAKLEVLKNKDATSGWQYLKQALESHRSDPEKKEQISFALKAFTDAASSAADEPMNRSAARICQAMCWFCLGSPEDVRNRLGEAVTDAYDAVYQAAIQYNEPRNTALATRESWVARHLPGWEVTDQTVAQRIANQKMSPAERLMKSNPTRPTRRLQVRMEPLLGQVNVWALSVTRLYEKVQNPEWLRTGWLMPQCNAFSRGEPGKLARAHLSESLSPGTTIDVRGITVSFVEAIPESVDGAEYVDVLLKIDVADYPRKEREAYRSRPWCVLNQVPSRWVGDDGRIHVDPVRRPGRADSSVERPWLKSDTSKWFHGNGFRMGPGFKEEVAGWRRFRRVRSIAAVTLAPAGPLWPILDPRDPRPSIEVALRVDERQ